MSLVLLAHIELHFIVILCETQSLFQERFVCIILHIYVIIKYAMDVLHRFQKYFRKQTRKNKAKKLLII